MKKLEIIKEETDQKLEMDKVNRHRCMQSFIKVIKDMHDLFGENWKDKMPNWM